LHDVKAGGGTREMALLRNRHEMFQLPQVHHNLQAIMR
jgi:hypothetical protein